MRFLEGIALWVSMAFYMSCFFSGLIALLWKKEGIFRTLFKSSFFGGIFLHGMAIVFRWIETGHAPVMGAYENSLLGAFFLALSGTILLREVKKDRIKPSLCITSILIIVALALLLLGNGLMGGIEYGPLEAPYRSNWLWVHVTFAWFAFSAYLLSSILATVLFARNKNIDQQFLDEFILKTIIFGFISDTIMIGAGAIWAHGLWGSYWSWDPIETWSLIVWLIYGLNLHLRLTLGWKGKKAAIIAIISAFAVIISFFGIGFVTSSVHGALLGR